MPVLTLFALLSACVPNEQGIDNTLILGTVKAPPVTLTEQQDGTNDTLATAEDLGELTPATLLVQGDLGAADVDWYTLVSPADIPGQVLRLELDTPAATATYRLVDFAAGTDIASGTVTGSGDIAFPIPPAAATDTGIVPDPGQLGGATYALELQGSAGAYTLVVPGPPWESTRVLVGAWSTPEVSERIVPLAGSDVTGWRGGTAAEGYVWVGDYAMYLVRGLQEGPEEDGLPTWEVDEDVQEAWLFAGDWPNLNSPNASGTWFSSQPVEVDLATEEPRSTYWADAAEVQADPLTLDAIAETPVGIELDEVEPNDIVVTGYPPNPTLDPASSQPMGELSGPGFLDIVSGSMDQLQPGNYDYHDVDAFTFTVPTETSLFLSLSWDAADVDLDVFVFDEAATQVGEAAGYYNPDVGGSDLLSPGVTYTLVVAGWLTYGSTATDYELRIEQLAP